jgi:oligosaccharide translocation protein RFT1
VCFLFGYIWLNVFDKPNDDLVGFYNESIILCCLAAFVELFGEPVNCLLQIQLKAKQRVYTEAISLLLFHLAYVYLAVYVTEIGSLAYSYARLLYSLNYVIFNYYFFYKNTNLMPINKLKDFFVYDSEYLSLVRAYYTQSVFKQILTEGEKYVITALNLLTFSESGVYDIINNLGSLIARFVFLPIEDASYYFFTNSFKRGLTFTEQLKKSNDNKETVANLQKSKEVLENLLKFMSMIGIFVFIYGQSYSKLLLRLYGGDKLSGSDTVVNMLRLYCFYTMFLAVNGLTESFLNATMSDAQLKRHNYRLVLFSIVYLLLIYFLNSFMHIYGLIIANTFNMLFRIVFNIIYIKSIFGSNDILKFTIPSSMFVNLILVCTLMLTKFTEHFDILLLHFSVGLASGLVNLFIFYKNENKFIQFLFGLFKEKRK